MSIGKIICNLGKAAINRAGFMTERQMLAATTRAGRYARDVLSRGGNFTDELAGSILQKSLPKGIKGPDFVTFSADAAADWVAKDGSLPRELVANYLNNVGGFNNIKPKTSESIIFYNPDFFNENVFAHEFRHLLDQTVPFKAKLKKKLAKLLLKFDKCQNQSKKWSIVAQEKYTELEEMIIAKGNLSKPHILEVIPFEPTKASLLKRIRVSEAEFDNYITAKVNNLLYGQKVKHKLPLLKFFISMMKTESNAQRAGAKLTRAIGHIKPNESCRSDMSAIFHDEVLKILQQELRKQRKNYYKSFLGFKTPKEEYIKTFLCSKAEKVSEVDLEKSIEAVNVKKTQINARLQDAITGKETARSEIFKE